jgi:prepilin-type N-terminal cleavage/methylation domain-containing protein
MGWRSASWQLAGSRLRLGTTVANLIRWSVARPRVCSVFFQAMGIHLGTDHNRWPHVGRISFRARSDGFGLLELLLVVSILGSCLLAGSVSLVHGLRAQQARGTAQDWQAAIAWAQIGVLWQGGSTRVGYSPGSIRLSHDLGLCGGDLGSSAPAVPVGTNLSRWRDADGVAVSFAGTFASPDGGGSLFFDALQGSYRVVVRPESGLTTRTRVETAP